MKFTEMVSRNLGKPQGMAEALTGRATRWIMDRFGVSATTARRWRNGTQQTRDTQRPSHTIVDPALRDLFGYRCAFRCTTDASSDIVLGHGWSAKGYNAASIDPMARGVAWLLAEDGIPRRIKAAYLDDAQIATLARRAALLRGLS